ncbi:MAG TPA: presqualene diphosphate synthase HpnD [Mycobacteriales bacterium]|jgi:phytoene synthase|nr:presqualene diphosphate synthase HpnD [Mycobacteriales bacterium]
MTATLDEAYSVCETVTRTQARNFHYGIRLLPRDKRLALCAVYALARRVDDIGDGDLPDATKRELMTRLRSEIDELADSSDPVLLAVRDAATRMPIPMSAFDELIDGVEMDLDGSCFATFDELVGYCRCVAGAIGRLCLGVFGSSDPARAPGYADQLGIALQQINILRDIREDLVSGRVYLPADELSRYSVELRLDADGALVDDGGLSALIRAAAERARQWYAGGLRLVPLLDRRSAASALAMSGIYRELLDRIAAEPALVRDRRLSLSGWTKASVATRALIGRA